MLSSRRHCSLRIQQPFLARPKTKLDESARIRHGLGLPTVVGLILAQRALRRIVPPTRRLALHVMLFNQGLLNLPCARGVDRLLSSYLLRLPAFLRSRTLRGVTGRARRTGDTVRRALRRRLLRRGARTVTGQRTHHGQHAHNPRQLSQDPHPHTGQPQFARSVKTQTRRNCCLHDRGFTNRAPVSTGPITVTEVYRPGRSYRPVVPHPAGAPGTPHPAHSSARLALS